MVPDTHVAALCVLAERLASTDIVWALTGSTSFALQGVPIPVHDIDVQTDATGAYRIAELFADKVARPVAFSEADRIRSHFGALSIAGVTVELLGGLQKRLPDGHWEEPVDVRAHRRFVQLADLTLPVLDLAYEERAYRTLGRVEKAELLRRHLAARVSPLESAGDG
jgi:hypothetical protein